MPPTPAQSVDPRAVSLWRLTFAFRALVNTVFVAVLASAIVNITPAPRWLGIALVAATFAYGVVRVGWFPQLRYRLYRYEVGEHELDIQQGILVVRRTLVPLVRMQHVDTSQGPLAKRFGLSAVTVSTAATTHVIPALSDEVAEELRSRIAALSRVAREST